MTPLAKQDWLHIAETLDSLRVVPRVFLLACFVWTVGITHELLHWYTGLPKDERSLEASGFASVVFLTVTGFLKLVYDRYANTSRDWNAQPALTITTASVSTTTGTPP